MKFKSSLSQDVSNEIWSCSSSFAENPKKALRAHLLQQRAALAPSEAARLGYAAQQQIMHDPFWCKAAVVALYMGVRDEMPTDLLIDTALAQGKRVYLPRCLSLPKSQGVHGPGRMTFEPCQSRNELVPGPFGLLEPLPSNPLNAEGGIVLDTVPDMMIMPAVALDGLGVRLGYGGGYYDRFLGQAPWSAVPRLGLVFALQIVKCLPREPWDRLVHGLASEEGVQWL